MSQPSRVGICPCCGRKTRLTFHHLVPRHMHRRAYFRKKFSRDERNKGIAICRQCHDGIHRFYSSMELAKQLNTLDKLLHDEKLASYFAWVSKQRVRIS